MRIKYIDRILGVAHSMCLINDSCFSCYPILQMRILGCTGQRPETFLSVRLGRRSPFLSSPERLTLESPQSFSLSWSQSPGIYPFLSPGYTTPTPLLVTGFVWLFVYVFSKDFIYLFLEREEGKGRGRGTSMYSCLSHAPY